MKILILANSDIGLYKFRKEFIQKLLDNDNEVYLSLPYGEYVEDLKKSGCLYVRTNVDRRGINPIKDLKLLYEYFRIISFIKPNKVITYTIKPNIYGGLICRIKGIKYFSNITGLGTAFEKNNILKKIIVFMYRISLRKAKAIFFENVENKHIFIENLICDDKQSVLLNGAGVNLDDYQFSRKVCDDRLTFLFVGRIMKEKGVEELFEVACLIRNKYQNVFFDIVGMSEENYDAKINELVSGNIINFHGYQKNVIPFYQNCDCLVLPSYHEGMSNTLLEAAAIGRPLITTNISGCKEAVLENENGFLCERQNVVSLYNCIEKFINLSSEERAKMHLKSRQLIEANFAKEVIVDKTFNAFMKL